MYLEVILGIVLVLAGALYHRYHTDPERVLRRLAIALEVRVRPSYIGVYRATALMEDIEAEVSRRQSEVFLGIRDALYPGEPALWHEHYARLTRQAAWVPFYNTLSRLWDDVFGGNSYDRVTDDTTGKFAELEGKLLNLMAHVKILEKLRKVFYPKPLPVAAA
jgi:hypothetical protein